MDVLAAADCEVWIMAIRSKRFIAFVHQTFDYRGKEAPQKAEILWREVRLFGESRRQHGFDRP